MGLLNLLQKAKLGRLIKRAVDDPHTLADSRSWMDLFTTAWHVEEIRAMLSSLQGYKTYFIAALMAVVTMLHLLGKIDDATYQSLLALLASGGVATVAAKINRLGL